MWYLEVNRIVDLQQAGFRSHHRSADDNISQFHEEIVRSLINALQIYSLGVFIDLEKAYDMVCRTALFLKPINLGLAGKFLKYIVNLFTDTSITVRINNSLSDPVLVENGIIQGSVISPILFLIMINGLGNRSESTKHVFFADDTALIRSDKNLNFTHHNMQEDLDNVQNWCTACMGLPHLKHTNSSHSFL
jgi:ribonuclease P/MRP protein subunit RPP40